MPVRTAAAHASLAVLAALLVALMLAHAWAPVARGASPAPSPAQPAATVDLTGHWAVAGTSGFDIAQDGGRIDGTSMAGVRFAGTVSGLDATFRFWSGSAYAMADPEDRGSGSFRVTPDGRVLIVSWRPEKASESSLDPVFTAVRVATLIDGPSSQPQPATTTWFTPANLQVAQWLAMAAEVPLETVIGYLILASNPSPAQLHQDALAYEAMLYLFRDWDRDQGIKPRPEP
jgi:hypothetical protein